MPAMDWELAVEKNLERLKRVLAVLVGMVAGGPTWPDCASETPKTLPRRLHRAVLRLLRPTESAVRRLAIVAARNVAVELPRPRPESPPARPRRSAFVRSGTGIILPRGMPVPGRVPRVPPQRIALPLFDPPRRAGPRRPPTSRVTPRIICFGYGAPPPAPVRRPPRPDDPLDARRLMLRLAALRAALDDLPGLARRFARWRAARAAAWQANPTAPGGRDGGKTSRRARRLSPLRLGRPPGQLAPGNRRRDPVHGILGDVHYFAREALADTS
jgi:hypothetical protein